MSDYKALSVKELLELAKKTMNNIHHNLGETTYPEVTDDEYLKIKIYQAIDRVKMYTATVIAKETFYSFDIERYVNVRTRDRKMLIKIINGLKDLSYEDIRNKWHESHKELFYIQKESLRLQKKLSNLCIIARLEKGVYAKEGFIRLIEGKYEIVESIADATEFVALSDKDSALEYVNSVIAKETSLTVSTFFNHKIAGRSIYY